MLTKFLNVQKSSYRCHFPQRLRSDGEIVVLSVISPDLFETHWRLLMEVNLSSSDSLCLVFYLFFFHVPMRLCIAAYEENIALALPCENKSLIYGLVCFIENFSKSRVPWSIVKCFIQILVFLFWQIRLMMLSKKHTESFKVSVKSEFQQQQQIGKIFWEKLILSVCLFTACTDKLFNKKLLHWKS